MLIYRFDRIFKARGIANPFSYLRNAGFSDTLASRIKNNKVLRLNMNHLEKLCILLKCTPNDLMAWVPDSNTTIDDNHPLNSLRQNDHEVDMVKTINSIPIGKLAQIEQLIKDELSKK
nr:helix-turn-helix transcriptional regulator [uncultured Carboxylicivirga sp.]